MARATRRVHTGPRSSFDTTVGDGLNVDRYTLNTGTYYVRYTQLSGSDPYTFRIVSDYAAMRATHSLGVPENYECPTRPVLDRP